ncbi:hypothetical protein [Amycolatopsis sp. Hca4]|uniref:hypothetical protein n=1 Tax=Amycolatopsis sp. Hca4 TaxID=2742131 RepID=UPI001591FECE|nr:hypothetical protein [Amycolatopsis sp. Hca4]QKV74179.1 hypothetical protein HUT10_10685 [Amycolatopsis sp. Hca4]
MKGFCLGLLVAGAMSLPSAAIASAATVVPASVSGAAPVSVAAPVNADLAVSMAQCDYWRYY